VLAAELADEGLDEAEAPDEGLDEAEAPDEGLDDELQAAIGRVTAISTAADTAASIGL
jgi:hypothetical protein